MTRVPAPGEALRGRQIPVAPPAPRAPEVPPVAEATRAAQARPDAQAPPDAHAPAGRAARGYGPDPALAQWWRRLLAFFIDAIVLTLVTGALWGRLLASFANRMSNAADAQANHAPAAHGAYGRVFSHTTGPYLIVLVATIILAIVYYWLLTGYWGTTIGKRALGTWVVGATDRSRLGLRRSFLRALVFVLGGEVVPLFFLVDNLWLTADRRRRALHDKAAGSLVVRTPPQLPTVQ